MLFDNNATEENSSNSNTNSLDPAAVVLMMAQQNQQNLQSGPGGHQAPQGLATANRAGMGGLQIPSVEQFMQRSPAQQAEAAFAAAAMAEKRLAMTAARGGDDEKGKITPLAAMELVSWQTALLVKELELELELELEASTKQPSLVPKQAFPASGTIPL